MIVHYIESSHSNHWETNKDTPNAIKTLWCHSGLVSDFQHDVGRHRYYNLIIILKKWKQKGFFWALACNFSWIVCNKEKDVTFMDQRRQTLALKTQWWRTVAGDRFTQDTCCVKAEQSSKRAFTSSQLKRLIPKRHLNDPLRHLFHYISYWTL